MLLSAMTACDGTPSQSEKPPTGNQEDTIEEDDPSESEEPAVTVDKDSPMLINTILEQDQS